MNYRILAAVIASLAPGAALAADCNFNRMVGACQARITIDGAGGSKPSYWAEITVSSSAPSCSKVDYFIDNTPHTAVLRGGNSDGESLSGTTAITPQTIRVQRCTAFEDRELVAAQSPAEFFTGSWGGTGMRSGFGSNPSTSRYTTISISVSGFSASVQIGSTSYSGGVSGSGLSVSKNWDGAFTESISISRNGDGSISVSGSGAPSNFSGTFSRN